MLNRLFGNGRNLKRDLNYFLGALIVSTVTSAFGTEVDLDFVKTRISSSDGFHALERHQCFAFGTANVFFHN